MWLLAAVTPASALALGSVPVEVLACVSVLAGASAVLLWREPAPKISRSIPWVLFAFGVLFAMTLVQAIPLPASVCRLLSPASAEIWERALAPMREPGPAWHTLSVAPAATRIEVLRELFYVAVFLAAVRVASLERGKDFLVRIVVVSSALMGFAALGHMAVSAETVFGLYRPREVWAYRPGHLAPLLNSNHLAAYLSIGAIVSFGTVLSRRSMPRALSGSMALVLAATALIPGSRGATGALLFGLALTLALTLYTKRRFRSAAAEGAVLAACALAATIIVAVAMSDAREHLLSRDLSKVDAAKRSLRLIAESPWFGYGRGAFETVFSAVRESTVYMTWTNPEDIVIQWLVEWGIPVSVTAFGALAWAVRPQVLLGAVRPAIGPWVAVVATVLHDLVDYHLEIPGVVALVLLCVAIVVTGPASSAREVRHEPRPRFVGRPLVFGVAGAMVVALVLVAPHRGHTLAQDRRALSAMAVDAAVPRERFEREMRAALLRHPGEPFFALMGAVRAQAHGEGSVVPWVGRALERNAKFGRAHFVLARSLASRYPAQARLEYRLAYEYDGDLRNAVVREALPIVDGPIAAFELVPDGELGVEILDTLVQALAPRLPSTAAILDAELARRAPQSAAPARRRLEAAVVDALTDAPWCAARGRCTDEALAAAADLVKREPDRCSPHVYVARIRAKTGDVPAALDGLEDALKHVTDRAECQKQLIQLALDHDQTARADAALDKLVQGGCGAIAECVDLYGWAASMEERRGHYVRAVRLYRRVLDLAPDREDILQRIGELGHREGLLADGLEAYRALASRHPEDPTWQQRIAELRANAQRTRTGLPSP